MMKKIVFGVLLSALTLGSATYAMSAISDNEMLMDAAAKRVPQGLRLKLDDIYLGEKDAPVQLVEYASMTCPHCEHFHTTVVEKLKETYIKEGKVRFVFRELPWDNMALAVAMISRCAPKEQYYSYLDAFFSTRESWVQSKEPLASIKQVARLGGMSAEGVEECLKNKEVQDIVTRNKKEAVEELGVKGTPTLFINGQKSEGVPTFEQLSKAIDDLLAVNK